MRDVGAFDIHINPLSKNNFLEIIESRILNGNKLIQNGVNAASIVQIYENTELKEAIKNSDLVNIDGISVVWALRFLGYKIPERVPCPDLAESIMKIAEKNHYRIFLLGATDDSLLKAIKRLKEKFPAIIISGHHNGYFCIDDEPGIIEMINKSNADILLIGMPSPKKELFIKNSYSILNIKYSLGVGGFFDILSGVTRRAPSWVQKIGLEWFFRFMQEPGRLWKRYLVGNIKFIWLVIREKRNRIIQSKVTD